MLTPAFELQQDDNFVYVYIKTPYIKISNVEFFIEGCQFKFYVKPYFLRLNLPGKIVENGEESASYDVEKGLFTVKLPKLVAGYHFPDLDLLTKLLAPSGQSSISAPIIEVVSDENVSVVCEQGEKEEDEEDFWEWDQDLYDEKKEHNLSLNGPKYGFASQKSCVFHRLKDNLKEIVENPNPDELSYHECCVARIAAEQAKFDPDYYLADYFDSERLHEVLKYIVTYSTDMNLTDEENAKLRQLPNKEYLLDSKEEKSALLSLIDIIFAYSYNHRSTLGENTVESAWTISTLSPTLSWFENFTKLQDVLVACYRRCLAYPLYRHWELTCKVMQDVKDIFSAGRRKILKCLLEIHLLFNLSEPRYILNELYITDYCIWIQKVKKKRLDSLTKKLAKLTITKDDVGFELKELEAAGLMVYREESSQTSGSEDSETSSSDAESSSDTEDETSSDDDRKSTEDDADASTSEVSDIITTQPNVDGVCEKLCSVLGDDQDTDRDKLSETSECDETTVEILPSKLFQTERTKPLVEVISDSDQQNNTSHSNCATNNNSDECQIENSSQDNCLAKDECGVSLHQTELISEKIVELSING